MSQRSIWSYFIALDQVHLFGTPCRFNEKQNTFPRALFNLFFSPSTINNWVISYVWEEGNFLCVNWQSINHNQEHFSSSDYCDEDVGLENGLLPDSSLSASSSYDPLNVGAEHGRLGQDTAGGAWCPQGPVGPDHDQQWLGVNLTKPHVIRSILTQGRCVQKL